MGVDLPVVEDDEYGFVEVLFDFVAVCQETVQDELELLMLEKLLSLQQ